MSIIDWDKVMEDRYRERPCRNVRTPAEAGLAERFLDSMGRHVNRDDEPAPGPITTVRYVVRPIAIEFPPPEDVPLLEMCACKPRPSLMERHMADRLRAFNEVAP